MKTPLLPGSRVCFNINNEAEYKTEADKVPGLEANVETLQAKVETLTNAVIALEDELGYSYFPQGYTSPFNYYAITVTADNGATTTGSGTYREGSEVTISVTPATDYHFTGWSDGEAQATRTVTVTAAATYTATTEAD
jgi:hypothetical protein